MAANTTEFATWLNKKLRELNTDESVFGAYIIGILEDDDSPEEKRDAVEGILGEILTENIEELIQTIFDKWKACGPKAEDTTNTASKLNVDEQLAKLLESTKVQAVVKERQYTAEEKKIREQILAQYSQTEVSDEEYEPAQSDEEGEKHGGGGGAGGGMGGLTRNTNALDVQNLQKEKREQARMDSAAKKLKDKEDREKQKQMREEKKEKRKTVKGERKR